METNPNIIRLMEMLETPEAYSEQKIRDIINSDEETREAYRLMVASKQGYIHKQKEQPIDIQAAWQRFEDKHYSPKTNRNWMQIAASFIGILLITGMAFAAYHLMWQSQRPTEEYRAVADSSLFTLHSSLPPVHFDDVRLDSILSVVSAHYGKTTHFRSNEAKTMKFIMTWMPDSSLTKFIDGLNMFDRLQLTLSEDTIFVEIQEGKEDLK